MQRYIKRLLLKEDIFKDWLFWGSILFFISNFIEVIYDYFDEAPNTRVGEDIFIWFLITLAFTSPFFLWRYLSLKKYFKQDKPRIFISFATNDQTLVETIKTTLEKNSDYEYWWQNDLKAGQNYKEEIERSIENSSAVLIMYSSNYEASENIKDWELPFIKSEEKNRDDLTIIPCVVGEYKEDIPFSNKYQVVPSRSTGFHRMISSQVKKEIKHLAQVINYQLRMSDNDDKNELFTEYQDSKIFTRVLLAGLGFAIFFSVLYLFLNNKIDNSLDKAINFGYESLNIHDEVLVLKEYYDVNDFHDEAGLDIVQHRNASIYINLLNDYLKKEELLGYPDDWNNFLISAYNLHVYYGNYLLAIEDQDENEQKIQYENWNKAFGAYTEELCSLLETYIVYEAYTFNKSSIWYEENYENICNSFESSA